MSMTETTLLPTDGTYCTEQPAIKPTRLTFFVYNYRIPNIRHKHKHSNRLYNIYAKHLNIHLPSYMELGRISVRTNLRNWRKNLQRTRTKLLSAVRGVTLTSISIVSLRNEGFPPFCLCLTTGRHFGFTDKFTEFVKQTAVRELLLRQCCDVLFAIVAVSCMQPCLI